LRGHVSGRLADRDAALWPGAIRLTRSKSLRAMRRSPAPPWMWITGAGEPLDRNGLARLVRARLNSVSAIGGRPRPRNPGKCDLIVGFGRCVAASARARILKETLIFSRGSPLCRWWTPHLITRSTTSVPGVATALPLPLRPLFVLCAKAANGTGRPGARSLRSMSSGPASSRRRRLSPSLRGPRWASRTALRESRDCVFCAAAFG